MPSKKRDDLYNFFKTGAKPSGENFRDLIDSALNVIDDGIEKPKGSNNPLKIMAYGEKEKLLDFYIGETSTWSLSQKPEGAKPGLNFEVVGSSKLFIESDSGNIGLSTTKPTTKLHIEQGELRIVASNDESTTRIGSFIARSGTKGIGIGGDRIEAIGSADQDIFLIPKGTGILSISSKVRISSNVGIGTDPKERLSILGGALAFHHPVTSIPYVGLDFDDATDALRIRGNRGGQSLNTDHIVIKQNSGNVGIGTTKPTTKLHIEPGELRIVASNDESTTRIGSFLTRNGTKGIGIGSDRIEAIGSADQDIFLIPKGAGILSISSNVGISGNLGIGVTSPTSKLEINGRVDVTYDISKFNRLEAPSSYGRAQLVLSSHYSDLVIASNEQNENHGSTLTFATYSDNAASKWVINKGNNGKNNKTREEFLDFGYSTSTDSSFESPHIAINDAKTVLTLDGKNRRVGIGTRTPKQSLDVNGNLSVSGNLDVSGNLNVTGALLGTAKLPGNSAGTGGMIRGMSGNENIAFYYIGPGQIDVFVSKGSDLVRQGQIKFL